LDWTGLRGGPGVFSRLRFINATRDGQVAGFLAACRYGYMDGRKWSAVESGGGCRVRVPVHPRGVANLICRYWRARLALTHSGRAHMCV